MQEIKIDKIKKATEDILMLIERYNKDKDGMSKGEIEKLKEWSRSEWEKQSTIIFKKPKMTREEIEDNKAEGWFNIRPLIGYSWAMFLFLLGGRGVGKSYAVLKFYIEQFLKYGRIFYWIRLTPTSAGKLLKNNAQELVDPDIRRQYGLDLVTTGHNVYHVVKRTEDGKIQKKVLMCKVLDLATFYNTKGTGLYDKDYLKDPLMYYNICLDEMNRESAEKKTFDIVYSFANQLENIIRKEKDRVRIICIGNTIAEASDILRSLDFIPQKFGTYKLKRKRAVVEYSPLNEQAKKRLSGSAGDIISGMSSTFTNEVKIDYKLVKKEFKKKARCVLKFGKTEDTWFTLWNDNYICKYNNDINVKDCIYMARYIGGVYQKDSVNAVIESYDYQQLYYDNISTQIMFEGQLRFIKSK